MLSYFNARPCIIQIPVEELVPGDIVHLSPGDVVPADMTIVSLGSGAVFTVQEACLTGESTDVFKCSRGDCERDASLQGDADWSRCTLFAGTQVTLGRCIAVVDAIGAF